MDREAKKDEIEMLSKRMDVWNELSRAFKTTYHIPVRGKDTSLIHVQLYRARKDLERFFVSTLESNWGVV